MCEASYLSSDGSYGVSSSDEPVQKTSKGPAITAIVLGTLALLSFGGLGVTGLLQSYEVIHLSPSWFLNVIETLGGASPFPGLWAITGVGVLGGFSLMWGIYQMHEFNKEAKEIQKTNQDFQLRRNKCLADFSTTRCPGFPPGNGILEPETIDEVSKRIPVNCYTTLPGRCASTYFLLNDNNRIYHLYLSICNDSFKYYIELYELKFQYYDSTTNKILPEGPLGTIENMYMQYRIRN